MASGYNHFTGDEREELQMLIMEGHSKSDIALLLGKHRATIYKELSRNSNSGRYSPTKATEHYLKRRVKQSKLESDVKLQQEIINLLKRRFSPGQIVLHFKKKNGNTPISAESIYNFIVLLTV